MKKKNQGFISALRMLLSVFLVLACCLSPNLTTMAAEANYKHAPRLNAKAMEDIYHDPNAVYGFSPREDSERLGSFAAYGFSDAAQVEVWKQERIAYHESFQEMYDIWEQMKTAGKSSEEIARTISPLRNELRLASYKDDPDGLEKAKESNLSTYGHEEGPDPDQLYEKYNSWDTVI